MSDLTTKLSNWSWMFCTVAVSWPFYYVHSPSAECYSPTVVDKRQSRRTSRLFNTPTAPLLLLFSNEMNNFQNNRNAASLAIAGKKMIILLTLEGQKCVTIMWEMYFHKPPFSKTSWRQITIIAPRRSKEHQGYVFFLISVFFL